MTGPGMGESSSRQSWVTGLVNGFIDLIYPPSCSLCGRISSSEICDRCRRELIPIGVNICPKCGNPKSGNEPCPYCLAINFKFDRAVSLYAYEEPLRDAILDFKYHRDAKKGKALMTLMGESIGLTSLFEEKIDIIVPVPLTPAKTRRRSYNQSEVLAYGISNISGIPVVPYAVVKKRETPSQTGFDLKGRISNVEGSFAVMDPSLVRGKRILLVDDIITTGATVSECAKALKGSGAKRVIAVSLARGVLQ